MVPFWAPNIVRHLADEFAPSAPGFGKDQDTLILKVSVALPSGLRSGT